MKIFLKALDRLNEASAILMLATTCVVVFLAVLSRYVFKNPIPWTEEIARFTFIWLVFLGISIAERMNMHFRINFFIQKAPRDVQKITWIFNETVIFIALALLLHEGIQFAGMGKKGISAVLELRLDYIYVALPLAVFLTMVNRIRNLAAKIRSGNQDYFG